MIFRTLLVTLLAVSPVANIAAQDLIDGSNPDAVAELLKEAGYIVDRSLSSPDVIRYGSSKTDNLAEFHDCDAGLCAQMRFRIVYEVSPKLTFDDYNKFHAEWRFGKLTMGDDNTVEMSYNIVLTGGVDPENLIDTFDWWDITRSNIEEHLTDHGYQIAVTERQ